MKKAALLLICTLISLASYAQIEITHLVLFKLKPGITKSDDRYKAAVKALEALPKSISFISDWRAGENFSTRPIAYDYGLCVVFESKQALQDYLTHPAHVSAANLWKEIADWNIADFEEAQP